MINRLADEFSNELNNLGVRVGRLEDRVGNVKVNGDVRLRYLGTKDTDDGFIRTQGEYSKSPNLICVHVSNSMRRLTTRLMR